MHDGWLCDLRISVCVKANCSVASEEVSKGEECEMECLCVRVHKLQGSAGDVSGP